MIFDFASRDEDGDTQLHVAALTDAAAVEAIVHAATVAAPGVTRTSHTARTSAPRITMFTPTYAFLFPATPTVAPASRSVIQMSACTFTVATKPPPPPPTPARISPAAPESPMPISEATRERLDVRNNLGQTPLHYAVLTDCPRAAAALIAGGADFAACDQKGNTPFHVACLGDKVRCLAVMGKEASKRGRAELSEALDKRNYGGNTCAILSVFRGGVDVLKELASLGADLNAADRKSGRTPLHHAVEAGKEELVLFLLKHGAVDVNAATFGGVTPTTLAVDRKLHRVASLLRDHGGDENDMEDEDEEEGEEDEDDGFYERDDDDEHDER